MRYRIIVLGFFIIVLITISGCTSPHNGTSTGSNNQNLDVSTAQTTSTNSLTSIINCDRPPIDPVEFYKYLPDVQGYERMYGEKMNYVKFNKTSDHSYANAISDTYTSTDISNPGWVRVDFEDLGPCAENAHLNFNYGRTQSKVNYHGYPALHVISFRNSSLGTIESDTYYIAMNNRLSVNINFQYYGAQLSEAEAAIEKFANAIDFKGFAASV